MPSSASPVDSFRGCSRFSRYNGLQMPDISAPVKALARNRLGYAIFSGVKAVVTSFGRTLYVLWLQSTGFIFAVFAVMGGSALYKEFRAHSWTGDPRRFWATLAFTVVCTWFT